MKYIKQYENFNKKWDPIMVETTKKLKKFLDLLGLRIITTKYYDTKDTYSFVISVSATVYPCSVLSLLTMDFHQFRFGMLVHYDYTAPGDFYFSVVGEGQETRSINTVPLNTDHIYYDILSLILEKVFAKAKSAADENSIRFTGRDMNSTPFVEAIPIMPEIIAFFSDNMHSGSEKIVIPDIVIKRIQSNVTNFNDVQLIHSIKKTQPLIYSKLAKDIGIKSANNMGEMGF